MENEVNVEQQVPLGILTSIRFKVLSEEDAEKGSVKEVTVANEVTDPAFGFPNPTTQCHTCGAKDYRTCEGHIGCKNLRKDKAKNNTTGSPIQNHEESSYTTNAT